MDEELADGGQDSGEEMEEGGQESDKDEVSMYAPSEGISELGEEEPDASEDLTELATEYPCKFLVLLLRELRDKVCSVYVPLL